MTSHYDRMRLDDVEIEPELHRIEVWCWPPLMKRGIDPGHAELRIDNYFYGFVWDGNKGKRVPEREIEDEDSAKPYYGGWVGILRIAKDAIIADSYDSIYRTVSERFKKWQIPLPEAIIFRFDIPSADFEQMMEFINEFNENRPEYCFDSSKESKNCCSFSFDALGVAGIFHQGDEIPGEGFWPEEFITLIESKQSLPQFVETERKKLIPSKRPEWTNA